MISHFSAIDNAYPNNGESDSIGEEEGYGGYDDYSAYDYGSPDGQGHDGCTGLIATHNSCDINKFPEDHLISINDFRNVHKENFCCNDHAYVAKDECEVSIHQTNQIVYQRKVKYIQDFEK